MLRAFFQLGEGSQSVAGLGVTRIIDLHQDGAVALDDERIGGVIMRLNAFAAHAFRHHSVLHPDPGIGFRSQFSGFPTGVQAEVGGERAA